MARFANPVDWQRIGAWNERERGGLPGEPATENHGNPFADRCSHATAARVGPQDGLGPRLAARPLRRGRTGRTALLRRHGVRPPVDCCAHGRPRPSHCASGRADEQVGADCASPTADSCRTAPQNENRLEAMDGPPALDSSVRNSEPSRIIFLISPCVP